MPHGCRARPGGYNDCRVRPFRGELTVAFDASGVSERWCPGAAAAAAAPVLRAGPAGSGRLSPHPLEVNLHRPEEVSEALRLVLQGLDAGGRVS